LNNTLKKTLISLDKRKNIPNIKFAKEYKEFSYSNNKRFLKISEKDIKNISKEKILDIYKDRFSDFNNFTFFITGDVKKEEVKKYIKKYLANLPISKRVENYNFRGIKAIKGKQEFIRAYNNENISNISISYSKESKYSLEESIKLSALANVLKIKLREFIREDKSGVYGVSVRSTFRREPYENASIRISFSCDPKRKDELTRYIKSSIEDIKNNLVKEEYVNTFIKTRLITLDTNKNKTRFLLSELKNHYYYNDSLGKAKEYKNILEELNNKDIKKSANKYLNTNNIIYTQLNPKK
ncbi:MAG: insulinase family protein, partial [Campylobacteraceae bacterium]|nr:insulinase family protein [Campylobacteraceae bacterium]